MKVIRDLSGTEYAEVETLQRRQTKGWWVKKGTGEEHLRGFYDLWQNMWKMTDLGHKREDQEARIQDQVKQGNTCLCLLSEVDEQENEFGIISP